MLKRILTCALTPVIIAGLAVVAKAGASVESENVVFSGKENGSYFVKAYFQPSHTVLQGEGYGLTPGKNVERAYVRASSDGRTFLGIQWCGSYDSGRLWSPYGRNKQDTRILHTDKASVKDCNLCTQRTYYGWSYFGGGGGGGNVPMPYSIGIDEQEG